jgi:phospholipid-binding lipoprotein MlaA
MKQKRIIRLSTHTMMLSAAILFASTITYADEPVATTKSATQNPAVSTKNTNKSASNSALQAKAAVAAATAVNATSAVDEAPLTQPTPATRDPLEKFNRGIFTFNDKVDTYVLKPIATFYNTIMPKPLNEGIHNAFSNVGELPTIANDILQLNFYQMANDMWRFAINTTIGVGGLFDIASRIGLKYYANDFGLTLANYGWKNSTYLVLPFFGPSTIRDTVEIPVDYYGFSVYPRIRSESTRYQIYGVGIVDRRAQLLQYQDVLEEVAIDKYVFMRNAYMQRRAHQIQETQHLGYRDQQAANSVDTLEKKE